MSTVNKISMHSEKHAVCRQHVIQSDVSRKKTSAVSDPALSGATTKWTLTYPKFAFENSFVLILEGK